MYNTLVSEKEEMELRRLLRQCLHHEPKPKKIKEEEDTFVPFSLHLQNILTHKP